MKNIDIKNEVRLALDNVEYIYNDGMELVEQPEKVTPEQVNGLAMEVLNYMANELDESTPSMNDLYEALHVVNDWIKESKEEA